MFCLCCVFVPHAIFGFHNFPESSKYDLLLEEEEEAGGRLLSDKKHKEKRHHQSDDEDSRKSKKNKVCWYIPSLYILLL